MNHAKLENRGHMRDKEGFSSGIHSGSPPSTSWVALAFTYWVLTDMLNSFLEGNAV